MRREVVEWHNTMECLPTFEEFRELEYLRQTGKFNMYTDDIVRGAFDHGLYEATSWLIRCREGHISWIKVAQLAEPDLEKEHGPREEWITSEIRQELEERALVAEESRLRSKMEELRARREELASVRGRK